MNQIAKVEEHQNEFTELSVPLSLTESTAIGLARAEIDVQIATARKFPRSIALAAKNIRSLVTLDKDTAEECMYALPRGGKPIQGPSIRLAEIIFQCWGNARCDARVVDIDRVEKVVVAQGVYHDLETNAAGRATVRRSIVDRKGRIFSDDMITVTGNAACSIAKRNAILAGVPKTVWNRAYLDAREVVAGTIKTLAVSRDQAIAAFANHGVKPEQIFPAIGVAGREEITLDHIPVLRGMFSAIKNGEATVEEMFNPRKGPSAHEKVADPLKDAPAHDPDTGEIEAGEPVEGDADDTATETTIQATPREQLIHELRGGIMQGKTALKLLSDLSPEQDALLTKQDKEQLKADWKAFSAKREDAARCDCG